MSEEDSTSVPALPKFAPNEKVCGNCKLWHPHSVDHRGWVGPCRLQPHRDFFPPSAPICNAFAPRGMPTAPPRVETTSPAPVRHAPVLVRKRAELERPVEQPESIDLEGADAMTREQWMELFREALGEPRAPALASKWEGGKIQLVPGNPELQTKEIPIDALFHKVVMTRDRLRVLEQKINGHPKLTDAEKVEMQHYITRAYGSLTSFNLLFRDKADHFIGSKSDGNE